MELTDLYRMKGELHTKLEVYQEELRGVNRAISEKLSSMKKSMKPEEVKNETN